jgi:Flp pilus assembly pilin Flp
VRRLFLRLLRETSGQDVAEYALLLTLVALTVVASLSGLAEAVTNSYERATECHAKAQSEQARACEDTGPREPQN